MMVSTSQDDPAATRRRHMHDELDRGRKKKKKKKKKMALPVMMSSPSMRVKLGSSNKTWKASIVIHHRISFDHNYVDFRVSYCGIRGLDLCCCFTQQQIKQYYYNQSYKKQVCCSNSSNSW
jgi:hypothetical protein